MSIELKIKSKHLAAEPAIIKMEERKLLKQMNYAYEMHQGKIPQSPYAEWEDGRGWQHPYWILYEKFASLLNHRRHAVGYESRATYIARAFIAGKPYAAVEGKRKEGTEVIFWEKIVPKAMHLVSRYGRKKTGERMTSEGFVEWIEAE